MLIKKYENIGAIWICIGVYCISFGIVSILNATCRVINADVNIDGVIV